MNTLRYSYSVFLFLSSHFFITEVTSVEGLYLFYQQPEYPRDCKEVRQHCSSDNSSGVHNIKPNGYYKPFEVYCDNQFSPGGWTVIQRQVDGSLTFKRNWEDYRNGFGFLSSEFYIGNEKLSYLTNQGAYELQIDMMLANGSSFYVNYNSFRISDEWSHYAMVNAEKFSGNSSCVATSCPTEMVHESCSCQTSCRDPIGKTDCHEICVESCTPVRCFVTETNSFILNGESFMATGCRKRCFCTEGQLTCNNNYRCDRNAVCERRNNQLQCYCNPGYSGDGVNCTSICQTNEVYGTCSCQKSCRDPTGCATCSRGSTCYCPNGFYLQREDCVTQEECDCFIDGQIIPEGEFFVSTGCSRRCSCTNGHLTCNNNYRCDTNAVCERRDTQLQCYCNPGFSGDGVDCRSICDANEVYGSCSCQKSCGDPTGCVSCNGGNICYCPNGFYLKGGDCVPQERCGCFSDGRIIPNSETYVNSDCSERCTCNNDRLNCDSNYQCSPNAACRVKDGVQQCYCNEGYGGDGQTCTQPTDCNDVRANGNTRSDVYSIRPSGMTRPFDVFCNMTIDGGGWTVFQRRINGATNFYRNWDSYRNGFGDLRREFWLGNEKFYYLSKQANYEVRVDYVSSSYSSYYTKYDSFRIGNEGTKYRVTSLGSKSGNGYRVLRNIQDIAFSTYDRDNDGRSSSDCAEGHRSGWWHGGWYGSDSSKHCRYYPEGTRHRFCSAGNLNGDYNGGNGQNIYDYGGCNIKYTEMKIRRI